MGAEYYKGKVVPLFESMKCYNNKKYGLVSIESGRGYYLYELLDNGVKCRAHFNVHKGTLLELEVVDDELGVRCFDENGNDDGFMKLPGLR